MFDTLNYHKFHYATPNCRIPLELDLRSYMHDMLSDAVTHNLVATLGEFETKAFRLTWQIAETIVLRSSHV